MRTLLVALIALLSLILIGCFETTIALDEHPENAKVDRSLVGDWTFPDVADNNKTLTVIIRNLDDKQYYVEWSVPGEKPARAVGYFSKIKDATFAQLRELADDGSIPEKHLIMRITTANNKLGMRQLDDKWFEQHPATNTKELRKLLEDNLDLPAMYDGDFHYGTKNSS